MKNVTKLSEQDLKSGNKTSWHDQYRNSSWIFVGGLPYDLTEGDIISVLSQYGEVVNINLIRDKKSGKQKGFCFACYEDQRSTILAVDNLNGIKVSEIWNSPQELEWRFFFCHSSRFIYFHYQILGKSIRIDHVNDYKPPKNDERYDDITKKLHTEGSAPKEQMPESHIKRELEEKSTRKRSPERRLSHDTKRVKRERRSADEETKDLDRVSCTKNNNCLVNNFIINQHHTSYRSLAKKNNALTSQLGNFPLIKIFFLLLFILTFSSHD